MADPKTVDGSPDYSPSPFAPQRSTFPIDVERVQSGGLDDDPTDSGEPVRNKYPFKNLKGGRSNA